MPELPDVEVFKQYLDATSLHQRIETVVVSATEVLDAISARKLIKELRDHTFESSLRHGKYLFVQLNGGNWLRLHFGMTGRLKYIKKTSQEPPHSRVMIGFTNGYLLAYACQRKLGEVGLMEDVEKFIKKKGLGPDALDVDLVSFKRALRGRKSMIKSTLMNQRIIAGIGNIYADEILFQSAIHPRTKVSRLGEKEMSGVFRKMKKILHQAIDCGADPEQFPGFYLVPHRRKNERCPRCRRELGRIQVCGRTTYYCPDRQIEI